MKDFVKKLIEKLEKEYEYQLKKADECEKKEAFEMMSVSKSRRKNAQCFDAAIQVVKQLAEEYNNGWIPCSERLPEEEGYYLITIKYYHLHNPVVMGCNFEEDEWWNVDKDDEVIAWRELPEPFKG